MKGSGRGLFVDGESAPMTQRSRSDKKSFAAQAPSDASSVPVTLVKFCRWLLSRSNSKYGDLRGRIAGRSDKASRYLAQLDAARCNGSWAEIPELARKVEKHAPNRKCLVCTARAEAQIAKQSSKRPDTGVRPSTATTSNPLLHLSRELEGAIELENQYPEDAYQAQTSLSWLYWNFGDYTLAKQHVPHVLPDGVHGKTEKSDRLMDWTFVCMVKAAFIRGSSEEAIGRRQDIPAIYESCLESLESLPASFSGSPEYNFWWERFFSRCCGCFYGDFQESVKSRKRIPDPRLALTAFRSWAKHWGSRQGSAMDTSSESAEKKRNQRRLVWKSYYNLLSEVLQLNLPSYPAIAPIAQVSEKPSTSNNRALQYLELKKVEAAYESILLSDVSFPEASKVNHEVDEWVDTVMSNWSTLCGPDWQAQDLGELGKGGIGRNALDILYRAATRTFHSTSVLRHLFTVHASLAEFELAEKALDSYLELVTKGKARVEKSGEPEPGIDSDEVMLQTIAAGVEILCESGKRRKVQKSTNLAKTLEDWLAKRNNALPVVEDFEKEMQSGEQNVSLPAQILTSVYKAIAISKAGWARLTYETQNRAQLQAEAIEHFRKALRCDRAAEEDPSILFALALTLAETRDIEGAVAAVKQALASESRVFTEPVDHQSSVQDLKTRITRTTPLTECWHLLSLLLSARQDFETAEITCQTILDQVEVQRGHSRNPSEVIYERGFFDKQHFVEAKMTQMALVEINDGPELAVNAGSELLALYARFFDHPTSKTPPAIKTENPPPTATGTLKSFRSSFLRNKENKPTGRESAAALSIRSRRLSEGTSGAPTISINDDVNTQQPANHAKDITRQHSGKLQKRASKRSIKRSHATTPTRNQPQPAPEAKSTPSKAAQAPEDSVTERSAGVPVINAPADDSPKKEDATVSPQVQGTPEPSVTSNGDIANGLPEYLRPETATSHDPSEVGLAVSHDLRASVTAQFESLSSTTLPPPLEVKPGARLEHRPESDFFLRVPTTRKTPFFIPAPLFPRSDDHRFSLSLLQRIWLFIAALYRRAGMFEDARGAVDEAFKQAKLVEAAVAAQAHVGVKEFEEPGWGGVKSVEEIWADAYAEMGNLCLAEGDPYEAMIKYEGALSHYVDHPAATVGLANILLDMYAKKIPLQPKKPTLAGEPDPRPLQNESTLPVFSKFASAQTADPASPRLDSPSAVIDGEIPNHTSEIPLPNSDPWSEDPEALDRLAARDRAYGLLSALTKLGVGWDDSDAWFALARAYEESGQAEKAKEILWWVVELEEKRPVRHWRCLGEGYKLRH